MSNSSLNNLKSKIKIDTEIMLKHSSNVIGDSNGEINFKYKLLLTDKQFLWLYKSFADN